MYLKSPNQSPTQPMSRKHKPQRETKDIYYNQTLLGTIELNHNGKRLGIGRVALKMRELYPELTNHEIAQHLGIDKRNLHHIIGASPHKLQLCSSCGKVLKTERFNSRSRNQGMCIECRQKRLQLNGKKKEPFLCINCGTIFYKTPGNVKWGIKLSGRPPMFCGNPCYQSFRKIHHIKGQHRCQP